MPWAIPVLYAHYSRGRSLARLYLKTPGLVIKCINYFTHIESVRNISSDTRGPLRCPAFLRGRVTFFQDTRKVEGAPRPGTPPEVPHATQRGPDPGDVPSGLR